MEKNSIIHNDVQISNTMGMNLVNKLTIINCPGKHARLEIEGILNDTQEILEWQKRQEDYCISVFHKGIPVFYGIVMKAEFVHEGGLDKARLEAYAMSIKFDMEKRNKAYQNMNLSYMELIEKVVENTKEAHCYGDSTYKDCPPKPIIQYQESDWEFIKRLASRLGTVVYSDPTSKRPFLWIGMPVGRKQESIFSPVMYQHGISPNYQRMGGCEATRISDYEYYIVKSYDPLTLGSIVTYKEKEWHIVEIQAGLDKDEMVYSYTLGRRAYLNQKRYDNPILTGVSLPGEVIHTEAEKIKIKLDIDSNQAGDRYMYDWMPDTGSAMYCMPEKGSRVSLYFADASEESGRVINCVRTNQDECHDYEDNTCRSLTTAHHKKMFLNQESVGLDGGESGQLVAMEDDLGIALGSNKSIKIKAKKGLEIKGRKITFETKKELNIQN